MALSYNPEKYNRKSGFGSRTHPFKPGNIEFHVGQDYAAPIGTPIRSAADGSVLYSAKNNGGYGYLLILKHIGADFSSYYILYAHMTGADMPTYGTSIEVGNVIGRVWGTGASKGPHLHFEVIRGDAPINTLGNDEEVGFRMTDVQYRINPKNFVNWGAEGPYNPNPQAAQSKPSDDECLYKSDSWFPMNQDRLYDADRFVPPGGRGDRKKITISTVLSTTKTL